MVHRTNCVQLWQQLSPCSPLQCDLRRQWQLQRYPSTAVAGRICKGFGQSLAPGGLGGGNQVDQALLQQNAGFITAETLAPPRGESPDPRAETNTKQECTQRKQCPSVSSRNLSADVTCSWPRWALLHDTPVPKLGPFDALGGKSVIFCAG